MPQSRWSLAFADGKDRSRCWARWPSRSRPRSRRLPKSSALPFRPRYRICSELERLGHLQRVPGTRQWTVARPLVDLAANVLGAAASAAVTDAILRDLTHKVGEMCSFAVQVGDDVVYVASAEPPHEVTLSFRAGRARTAVLHFQRPAVPRSARRRELRGLFRAGTPPRHTPFTTVSARNASCP